MLQCFKLTPTITSVDHENVRAVVVLFVFPKLLDHRLNRRLGFLL